MLVDEVEVVVRAGDGGNGAVSWARWPARGPDGGSGGKGGDVWVRAASDLTLLNQFVHKPKVGAASGKRGERNQRSGKNGADLELTIPAGTVITNLDTGQAWELNQQGDRLKVCQGGMGGKGNYELRSSTLTTPKIAQPGESGEERKLKLVLKLLADFGLIGLPNAGKSSLLNELTAAKAQVAHYPFTTLEPNLGVLEGKVIADIPGLIEGAHQGKGLGIKFLKHIEKVKLLLHCVTADSKDVVKDYETVRQELEQYSGELVKKPEIILLTKADLVEEKQLKRQANKLKKLNPKVHPVSIYDWNSIESIKTELTEKTRIGGNE